MLNFDKFMVGFHPNNPKFDALLSNVDLTIICGVYYKEEENVLGFVFGKGDFWKETPKEELEEAIKFAKELFNAKDSLVCIELLVDLHEIRTTSLGNSLKELRKEKAYMAELNLDLFEFSKGKGRYVTRTYFEEKPTVYDE